LLSHGCLPGRTASPTRLSRALLYIIVAQVSPGLRGSTGIWRVSGDGCDVPGPGTTETICCAET